MRVVITGTTGYVATHLARALEAKGHQASLISVRDEAWRSLDFTGADAVVHTAALLHGQGKGQPWEAFERVNVRLTEQIAQKARDEGVPRFLFMSTLHVYGLEDAPRGVRALHLIGPDTPCAPASHYACSKLEAERALERLESPSFSVLRVRCPMVYGVRCPGNYAMLRKIALKLRVYPAFDNQRAMVHVDSLCAFLIACVERGISGVAHPQDQAPVCTADMIACIARANGVKAYASRLLGALVPLAAAVLPPARKAFGSVAVDLALSDIGVDYRAGDLAACVALCEPWEARP